MTQKWQKSVQKGMFWLKTAIKKSIWSRYKLDILIYSDEGTKFWSKILIITKFKTGLNNLTKLLFAHSQFLCDNYMEDWLLLLADEIWRKDNKVSCAEKWSLYPPLRMLIARLPGVKVPAGMGPVFLCKKMWFELIKRFGKMGTISLTNFGI